MAQEIEEFATMRLPEALKQLKNGYEAMEKIARYCHGAQKKKDYQQIYMQSQDYSKDALTNAAYHVNAIGSHLTQFLTLQSDRVEQLDIHIKILSDVRCFWRTSVDLFSNWSTVWCFGAHWIRCAPFAFPSLFFALFIT